MEGGAYSKPNFLILRHKETRSISSALAASVLLNPVSFKIHSINLLAAEKEMEVIIEQSPGEAICTGFFKQRRKSANKDFAVTIIEENIPSFNAPHDHMLQ